MKTNKGCSHCRHYTSGYSCEPYEFCGKAKKYNVLNYLHGMIEIEEKPKNNYLLAILGLLAIIIVIASVIWLKKKK